MNKSKILNTTSDKFRITLIKFITKYGDGHITKKAISWLKKTPFSELDLRNGDLIHVIFDNRKRLLGVIAIKHFGLDESVIVIHPNARKKGVGYDLTTGVLEDINRCYVKVANDNIPSLKLCFLCGMRAFELVKGPTGKPTLVLGLGDWDDHEWKEYHQKKR